jgi:hypothetical protein
MRFTFAILMIVVVAACPAPARQCEPHWSDAFPHANTGAVVAAVNWDDGTGSHLYFSWQDQFESPVVYQSPSSVFPVRLGGTVYPNRGHVLALATFDEDGPGPGRAALFAGGDFLYVGSQLQLGLARWDGAAWSRPGQFSGAVFSMLVHDDGAGPALYVGGAFTLGGSGVFYHVAKWTGTVWVPIAPSMEPNNQIYPYVTAIAFYDDGNGERLYATGELTSVNGIQFHNVARWSGTQWEPLGSGLNRPANALLVFDDGSGPALYVGGKFTTAGGLPASRIARWNGQSWGSVGSGLMYGNNHSSSEVRSLAVFDDGRGPRLMAAGTFSTQTNPVSGGTVAAWDGLAWSGLDSRAYGDGYMVCSTVESGAAALYVGGDFDTLGGVYANGLARLSATGWSSLHRGFDGAVNRLIVFDDGSGPALYAGGGFGGIGQLPAFEVAKWNGSHFSALPGLSPLSMVSDLGVFDDGSGAALYVAGYLGLTGEPVFYGRIGVARWTGADWQPIYSVTEASTTMKSLAVLDDGTGAALYAAGRYNSGDDAVLKWEPPGWRNLGVVSSGGYVRRLTVYDDGQGPKLYLGGDFTSVGGQATGPCARWDGQTWSAVGAGQMTGVVWEMAVYNDGSRDALYVSTGNTLKRYDGLGWSDVPTGGATIGRLAVADDGRGPALFAGGPFSTIGGVPARRIARWDGHAWSALGTGFLSGQPWTICGFDDGSGPAIFVGGDLQYAGGLNAANFAKWQGCPETCYANCDGSTSEPVLNALDFVCFLERFAARDPRANCDHSPAGELTVGDFVCFMQRFAAGCP